MKHILNGFLILSIALAAGERAAADDGPLFGKPIDPDGDCSILQHDGMIELHVPGSHHDLTLTPEGPVLNSPRVMKPVEGNFSLQARVEIKREIEQGPGRVRFATGGLTVWHNEGNFARFERLESEPPTFWFELFRGGFPIAWERLPAGKEECFIRVERHGPHFHYQSSTNGVDWTRHQGFRLTTEDETPVEVGFFSVNGTGGKLHVTIKDIQLEP